MSLLEILKSFSLVTKFLAENDVDFIFYFEINDISREVTYGSMWNILKILEFNLKPLIFKLKSTINCKAKNKNDKYTLMLTWCT